MSRLPRAPLLSAVALLAAAASTVRAQREPSDSASRDHPPETAIETWVGLARHSPQLGVLGRTPGLNVGLAAVRWSRRLRTGRHLALDYTADLLPAVLISPPYAAHFAGGSPPPQPGGCAVCLAARADAGPTGLFPRGSAFGVGANPLGLTAVLRPGHRVEPTLGLTGGMVWLDRPEPTTASARVNFTATAEAGLRVWITRHRGLTLTYRFHHLSNGGTADDNFAIASHVLSAGVRWQLGRRPDA